MTCRGGRRLLSLGYEDSYTVDLPGFASGLKCAILPVSPSNRQTRKSQDLCGWSTEQMEENEPQLEPVTTTPPEAAPPQRRFVDVRSWARDLGLSVLVSAFIIVFLYQPVRVEGT